MTNPFKRLIELFIPSDPAPTRMPTVGPPGHPNRPVSRCQLPPENWWCARAAGHGGPCAAYPTEAYPTTRRGVVDGEEMLRRFEGFERVFPEPGPRYGTFEEWLNDPARTRPSSVAQNENRGERPADEEETLAQKRQRRIELIGAELNLDLAAMDLTAEEADYFKQIVDARCRHFD